MFDLQHTLNLIDEGALNEAVDALETIVAQMPAYTPAYVLLAQTYEAQARWAEALHAWQRARFFAPNSPAIRDGLMRALEHQDALEAQDRDDPDAAPEGHEEGADDPPFPAPEASSAPAGAGVEDDTADTLFDAPHDEGAASAPAPAESEAAEEKETAGAEAAAEEDRGDPTHEPASEPPPADPVAPSPLDAEEPAQEAEAAPEPPSDRAAPFETEEAPEATEDDETRDDGREPRDDDTSARAGGFPPSAEPRPSPLDELMRQLPDTDQPLPEDLRDLDRLIDELEGARIDPQPDMSDTPAPDLESDIDDMVSETLARIYISQNQYEEAARVYLRLASQEPDRAQEHLEKAAALRDQARDSDA